MYLCGYAYDCAGGLVYTYLTSEDIYVCHEDYVLLKHIVCERGAIKHCFIISPSRNIVSHTQISFKLSDVIHLQVTICITSR